MMSNTLKNIIMIVGILIYVGEVIFFIKVLSLDALEYTLPSGFAGILGIICIRFAYNIAKSANKRYMRRFKKYEDNVADFEPSKFAVRRTRIVGIIVVVLTQLIFVISLAIF